MSEHIAHLAICDDCARLALVHPAIAPELQDLLAHRRDIAHLGAITRSADRWSAELIAHARDELARSGGDRYAAEKLAFVLGALTHRAADRLMKPIIRCWETEIEREECKVHQDLFVLKEVYGGPDPGPFAADLLRRPTSEAGRRVEEFCRTLLRRALIEMHTFAPDTGDIQAWLNNLFDRLQTFPRDIDHYARVATEWDLAKVKKYLIDKHYYRRDDPPIALARDIQRGSTVTGAEVVAALAAVEPEQPGHSRYARALVKGLDYLLAATALFRGEIDLATAKTRFDIGVPELALQD